MGRILAAVVLAPVLVGALWVEVALGTTVLWYWLQPAPWNHLMVIIPALVVVLGPAIVLGQTLRTRVQGLAALDRIVRIEIWGLAVSGPLALFSAFLIAGMASL